MKYFIFIMTTFIFTAVFYGMDLGLNVTLFNAICFGGLLIIKRLKTPTILSKIVFISVVTSAIIVTYHNTVISIIIHLLNWIIFIGVLNYKEAKLLTTWLYIGLINLALGITLAFKGVFRNEIKLPNKKKIKLSLYLIPIGIIIIFQFIYRISNPVFDDFINQLTHIILKPFEYLNIKYFPIVILGLILTSPIFFEYKHPNKELKDQNATDFLKRIKIRRKRIFKIKGLTNEYQAGIFLLLSLNILLVVVNVFDIYTVWINFKFEGQTLKTFVHEGTYMLIVSILISMGIILFFFRNNLNFYKFNSKLKSLTYFWIIQNIILSMSVFMRCYHYINNFGLAYKRIGVIVFIMAVIIGLITIYNKVKHIKTVNYVLRVNILSIFILLNGLTFFNWDLIIAKYNINNYQTSYVHFDFLSSLSNSSLFALQISPEQYEHILHVQHDKYPFYKQHPKLNERQKLYQEKIQDRVNQFKISWECKHWLEWNYADYKSYHNLIDKH